MQMDLPSTSWRSKYGSLLAETELTRFRELAGEFEMSAVQRFQELHCRQDGAEEDQEICGALNVLRNLLWKKLGYPRWELS
jgi:hypothetical protein